MVRKHYIFTLITIFISICSFAQRPRSFSKKPAVYITELNAFLATGNSPDGTKVSKLFTEKWNTGSFSEGDQRIIIKASNGMLINKLDIEHFVLMQETLMLGRDSVETDKYENWLTAIVPSIKAGNKTYLTLLNSSKNLFKDNKLYVSESKSWVSSKDNYIFNFEKNRVKISFDDIDLTCKAAVDFLTIYGTSGSYYLDNDVWEGSKGRLTWERVGFGSENIFAEIPGNYKLQFARGEIKVDTVNFTNVDFIEGSIQGSFMDRISSSGSLTQKELYKSNFPQFASFRKDLELGSYLEDRVQFKGGYTIEGADIIANGTPRRPATVSITYKDKQKILASSEYFSLQENKITAQEAEVAIYTDSGEIYHPKLKFNLNLEKKFLVLTRGKKGLEQAPFTDSDHEVEIYVDQVMWNMELPKIEFDMSSNDAKAIVESKEFYKEVMYERITRGMMSYHPVEKMRNYCIQHRKREFTFTEYAEWMKSKQTYLKPQIIQLADLGYLFYNPATDSIKVKRKIDHGFLSHRKLKDYDVIRFSSVIAARSNGYLNLINNTFVLEGVRAFRFSDSQSVYAFPHEQKVILKHKRRMEFGGKLTAGKFDFWSDKFDFDYYRFDISSDIIDSMRIYTKDLDGGSGLVAVKSVLRDINGTLEIDKPNNKSGLEDYPEYPIFTSKKGAVIAYDKKNIHGGAYKKDVFRFEVDPFTIDSLDNFTTSGLQFPGNFVSGGILPEFRYAASIMDDYSLGFERANPSGGYEMYGGAGHGEIDIKLSEEGFTAKGTIDYQGAALSSNDILMTPDSTLAAAESYVVKENDRYPNIVASDVLAKWMPQKDSMLVNTNGHTVKVFRDGQEFKGNLAQTSREIAGSGELTWDRAKLTSGDMKYKPNKVDALKSQIQIGSISDDKIAFASENMESHVDFSTRIGEFKANEKGNLTEFPFNAYASSMDEYKWDMDAETIELNKGAGLQTLKSYFVSRDPKQQGLKFLSTFAVFDMREGVIKAEDVPYIDVGDSRVFPFEGLVTIRKDADMQRLDNSKIFASRGKQYHEVYESKIKIDGRYELSGEGNYKYKDKHNTGQVVYMDKMRVKNGMLDSTVIATGFVKDSSGFTVSPKIGFKGNVLIRSREKDVVFNGYVKPLHSLTDYPSSWFRYNQQPNPNNVIIPAMKTVNEDKRFVYSTISLASDSIFVYPTMFAFKRGYGDLELTSDTGVFYYNEQDKTFYVGDSLKLLETSPRGTYLSYNDETHEVYSEGKIDFDLDRDNNFNGIMAGQISKMPEDSSFIIESMLALKLSMPEECYARMLEVIRKSGDGNAKSDNDNELVYNAMAEYLDDKALAKATSDLSVTGELKPTGAINRDFLFTNINLHYSPARKSFVSFLPVHLATLHGKQVNQEIEARIQIKKRRTSLRYTMYLEISKYDWFYFDYNNGQVSIVSTDEEFNTLLRLKGKKYNKGKYRLRVTSPRSVSIWRNRLEGI